MVSDERSICFVLLSLWIVDKYVATTTGFKFQSLFLLTPCTVYNL